MAGAIFAFTDAIPGATIGQAVQRIDAAAGTYVSEVKMHVFPGLSGTVVTKSTFTGVCHVPGCMAWRLHHVTSCMLVGPGT